MVFFRRRVSSAITLTSLIEAMSSVAASLASLPSFTFAFPCSCSIVFAVLVPATVTLVTTLANRAATCASVSVVSSVSRSLAVLVAALVAFFIAFLST